MSDTIIIAVISLLGTLGGSYMGIIASNKLVTYRIDKLEEKVSKHNNLIERTYKIEGDIKVIKQEVSDLKEKEVKV